MRHELIVGSRGSALARIQALAVGRALLERNPALHLRYVFAESSGDRSRDPSAAAITQRGGFTEDLGRLLDARRIDVAVHSWKDLPLRERPLTRVAASLPRADARDLLLVRCAAIAGMAGETLRVLSSSSRRRLNLESFMSWALPRPPAQVVFSPVRGDIETRLAKLLRGDGDALVVAKAAIDRLLTAEGDEFALARARVREALDQCRMIVLPLTLSPAAAGQGALALEVRRDAHGALGQLADINDATTLELVERERLLAGQLGDDDSPLGVTLQRYDFGDVEFVRGEHLGQAIEHVKLLRRGPALPRPQRLDQLWTGENPGAEIFERVAASATLTQWNRHTGLLIARAEALPETSRLSDETIVWTAGLATWRRLAARGVWVTGSDDSLGESGALAIRHLYPQVSRWVKLTHEQGYDCEHADMQPTYRLQRRRAPDSVHGHTHFFWRSGSQLLAYLREFPALATAWHGSGPGNTLKIAQAKLGSLRARPFLSAAQFTAELAP